MVLTVVVSRPFAKNAKGWGTQGLFSLTQREGHPPIFYSRTQRDHIEVSSPVFVSALEWILEPRTALETSCTC